MPSRKISLRKIGTEIRKSQKAMRAAIRGASKARQRALNAKIRKLDKRYKEVNSMCKTWNNA